MVQIQTSKAGTRNTAQEEGAVWKKKGKKDDGKCSQGRKFSDK